MRHAAAVGSFPLLRQSAKVATAEGSESNGATGSRPNNLSSSATNSGISSCSVSSSGSKEDTLERLPEGESCSSCWEGKSNFFMDPNIYHTHAASSELLQLPQQQHIQPTQERHLQQEPEQQQRFHQEVQRRPQKHEQDEQPAPPVCGRLQRKQQLKQLQKQDHSSAVEAAVRHGICGTNVHDAQTKVSDGGKTCSSTRGRSRGSSRANSSSSTTEENNSSKKQSNPATSAGIECLTTPHEELQVTADYTLISRGLVNMTYVQLEAARPQEELPPPDVGEIVESKAAHPDAQIFKAKVLERWRDPEHLWMFKLRSPEMAAPYLEPLKRKSRRCASSLQQQHNAARSSSCTPNSCSAGTTSLNSGSKSSDLQVNSGGCASASAPATCGSASASKKNQPHRSAGATAATAATAGPRAAAKTTAAAAAFAVGEEVKEKALPSPFQQHPVVAAVASTSCAVETRLAAFESHSASSSAAVAASSPGCSHATGVPLSTPSADRCKVQASLCRRTHPSQRPAGNTVASRAAAAVPSAVAPGVGTDFRRPASPPLLCQPPTAPAVIAPQGSATVTPSIACAAQSPCAVPPIAATVATGQQQPASATTRAPQPLVQPTAPHSSVSLQGTPAAAKPPTATAAATEPAAGRLPAAAPALASAFEESSLFDKQLVGCIVAGTPQQDACKPLSYSALAPELYLSPAPPTEAAPATAVALVKEEKEEATKSSMLRKFLNSAVSSLAPAVTSPSPDKSSGTISGANTTTRATFGSQQLAAVERRCSSPAELSLQFMSPSLESARTIAAGGAAPDIRNGATAVDPTAALSLAAATARKSWPARAELLLKDGIGLHQQRLQRLLLAAAASTAARESQQELERLAPSQPQQQQQQEPTQHKTEEIQAEQDVPESSAGGGGTFLTPSPGDVSGITGCCFTSPAAAAASDGAKHIEESSSSSSSQASAGAAVQVPNGVGGWMKAFPSTAADAATCPPRLLHDMHPHPNRQKQQQPQHRQQLREQQEHQQEQVQEQHVTTSEDMDEAEFYARHLMKPRRSLPAYQRLERMLFLKQLVPLSRTDAVSSFPFSPAAVPCASPSVANEAGASAPAPAAAVTSASSPVSATGAYAAVAVGIGEKGEGRDSPALEAAVAEPRAPAEVETAGAGTGAAAAARTEQISTAAATEVSVVSAVVHRSEATAATSVVASADMAAGVAAADAAASRPQNALPDTKKVRTSSYHVGIGGNASIKIDSSALGSAVEVTKPIQPKERLDCVEQQHTLLLSADRKTLLSCCTGGSNAPTNSSGREGSECGSEERCEESIDYNGRTSSIISEHCSLGRDARSNSRSGCCSSKSGTSPITSGGGGRNSSGHSNSSSNSSVNMEWEIEGSGKSIAVEDPAGLPCSLPRISSICCSGAASMRDKLHHKNSATFSAATVVTASPHYTKHQLQQREPQP